MENTRKGYEDLEVWKLAMELAMELAKLVHEVVSKWEAFYKYKHGQQWLDAADSIAANIAEGYGRYFYAENRNFCFYERGSLYESKTWLIKAMERSLVTSEIYSDLYSRHEILAKKLNNYINYIEGEMIKNPKRAKPS
jgi:four helix bundle protein